MVEVLSVSINKLRADPNQPRKLNLNDPETKEELEAMAESYRDQGIISPVEIDENYVIICGERRWRAAKKAELKEVPCIIKEGLTKDERLERQLIENLHRKNLLISECAEAIEKLVKIYGSQNKVAKKLGISSGNLTNLLTIANKGSEMTLELFRTKHLAQEQAKDITQIENPKTQDKVAKHVAEEGLSREETKELVKHVKDKAPDQVEQAIQDFGDTQPAIKAMGEMVKKSIEKLDAETKPDVDPEVRNSIANMMFMKGVLASLASHGMYCPDCKKNKLKWACCDKPLEDTAEELSKKYGEGTIWKTKKGKWQKEKQ